MTLAHCIRQELLTMKVGEKKVILDEFVLREDNHWRFMCDWSYTQLTVNKATAWLCQTGEQEINEVCRRVS